jgi:hypothetical protein
MTWRYESRAGVALTRTVHAERRTTSIPFLTWIRNLWQGRLSRAWRLSRVGRIGHEALWLCIHSREGAWNDQGAPYYGGLQMTYGWDGLVGDAGNLSPQAQMQAAETGYRQSGYSIAWLEGQWPNTSPPCLQFA